jgi:hypothetical protein
LGRLDRYLDPQVGLELINDRLKSSATLIVHPDQKLTVGPGEHVYRDQKERRQYPQQPIHWGAENR